MASSSLKKIKDPIHGYVYYSALEEVVLNHPLLLRLHHIRQNGAAFLTYPSMRVHRFEHSVGAMHIAGNMFLFGRRFSPDQKLDASFKRALSIIFKDQSLSDLRDLVIKANPNDSNDHEKEKFSAILSDGLYKLNRLTEEESFVDLLLFQAVRLATLVHDIGHPPFSHTFETALRQLAKESYQDHETVGVALLKYLKDDLKKYTQGPLYYLARIVIDLTIVIFDKEHPNNYLVDGLTKIVSSDIDADRLDYVRRDASAAGLTTNAYDLGRLYDAIHLVVDNNGNIELQWTAAALSTFESFLVLDFIYIDGRFGIITSLDKTWP